MANGGRRTVAARPVARASAGSGQRARRGPRRVPGQPL